MTALSFGFRADGDNVLLLLDGAYGGLSRGKIVGHPMTREAARRARDELNRILGDDPGEPAPAVAPDIQPSPSGLSERPLPISPTMMRQAARTHGYTGSECADCGSMRMVQNGTCEKCENCGATTGCS